MKNKISYTLLTFAFVLYLLHIVIPHHHHNQLICFNINHLKTSCCSDKSHHHENSSSEECCILNIPVVLNNEDDELKTECNVEDSQNTSFEFGTTSIYDFDITLLLTEVVQYGENCFSSNIFQFFSTTDLRAPPTII